MSPSIFEGREVSERIGIHLFQPPVFLFQLFEALEIGHFHAAVFTLPGIISAFGNPVLAADCFGGAATFYFFQHLDDLAFTVARFLHPSFSFGGNIRRRTLFIHAHSLGDDYSYN